MPGFKGRTFELCFSTDMSLISTSAVPKYGTEFATSDSMFGGNAKLKKSQFLHEADETKIKPPAPWFCFRKPD